MGKKRKNSKKPDPKLGLCLAGGGGLGFLHLGLFRALEELSIHPGIVAGTSSGAVLGAFYAAGKSADEIREILKEFKWIRIIAPSFPRRRGFLSTKRMEAFFKKHLGDIGIEDLPVKLKIAATNLHTGTVVGFTKGPLPRCLAASSSVPGIFEPVKVNGGTFYDAGGIYNLPLELFTGEGVKKIIAGNTIGRYGIMGHPRRVRDVVTQAYLIRTMHLTAMRTGEKGWQGKKDEKLVLIDYRSAGMNPSKIEDSSDLIESTYKQSLEVLKEAFRA
jgi:NTE family protein